MPVAEITYMTRLLVTGAGFLDRLGFGILNFLSSLFLILPLFSTLWLILMRSRRQRPVFHGVVCGLAIVGIVWRLSISPAEWLLRLLWGPWLYIGLALGMLLLEGISTGDKLAGSK